MLSCLLLLLGIPFAIIGGCLALASVAVVAVLNILYLPFELFLSFFEGGRRH
jgi:hypothetical protein